MSDGPIEGYGFPPLANPYVSDSLVIGALDLALLDELRALGDRSAATDHEGTGARWSRVRTERVGGGAPLTVGWSRAIPFESDLCARLVEAIVVLAIEANQAHQRFDCDRIALSDPPELLRFDRNEFRSPLPDLDATYPTRKLTALVRLTPDDGTDGSVGLDPGGVIELAAGEVLLCPSFSWWGVTRVGRGGLVIAALRLHGRPFR